MTIRRGEGDQLVAVLSERVSDDHHAMLRPEFARRCSALVAVVDGVRHSGDHLSRLIRQALCDGLWDRVS